MGDVLGRSEDDEDVTIPFMWRTRHRAGRFAIPETIRLYTAENATILQRHLGRLRTPMP